MPKSINLTGTSSKTYNLDNLATKNTRKSSDEKLLVQIWYWNAALPFPHNQSNPDKPEIGQMWLSKLITKESHPDEWSKLGGE